MDIIRIEDLSFAYPGTETPVLKHVNLTIEQGDFLAVVGNNGCGKSTLCKVLNGLIPHFIAGDFSGRVLVDGTDTLSADVGELARKAGYVYQDFENQIVRPTALDDASFACLNYGMKDYLERGEKALAMCGLSGKEKDYIWQLSGGQTHLLALAGALALGPDILILDEPIAQLDPGHADRIYEILKNLNENHHKTIIVIEHHTEYIADFCKNVLLLKEGTVEWKLPAGEALERVEELQECNIFPPQVTLAAWQQSREDKKGYSVRRRLPTTVKDGLAFFPAERFVPSGTKERDFKKKSQKASQEAVSFREVSVSYRSVKGSPKTVFKDLNLSLQEGEKIALIGSNGAGKSTLMKLLVGLLKPENGTVEVKGTVVKNMRPEELSRQISLVYQNPEDMFIQDTIEADIAYAMRARAVSSYQEKTKELLTRFRLSELAQRDGRLLSGGQMRRASLAIGVALNPEILLLDEPTANLDIATRKEIMKTLEDMKKITKTVMIATHDMQLVCEWAERIIVLCRGQVVADGTRDEIFGNQELSEMVGIRPPEIFRMGKQLHKEALCYTVDEFLNCFDKEKDRNGMIQNKEAYAG